MRADAPDRLRLSLLQVMKFVAFCAVGMACAVPMLNLWKAGAVQGGSTQGLVSVALFEAVVAPLAWVVLSFALIRRGVWRDKLIAALLLFSVLAALSISIWLLIAYTIPAYGNPYDTPERRVGAASVAWHLTAILALSAAAFFLATRLMRRTSPAQVGQPRTASHGGQEDRPTSPV